VHLARELSGADSNYKHLILILRERVRPGTYAEDRFLKCLEETFGKNRNSMQIKLDKTRERPMRLILRDSVAECFPSCRTAAFDPEAGRSLS
jgi:hypothetical protein